MNYHLFTAETYTSRRDRLHQQIKNGLVWILGNEESPKNYEDNTYHFRQDSNFLYYAGLDLPGLSLMINLDEGKTYLVGDNRPVEMVVWMGPLPTIQEMAKKVGIDHTLTIKQAQDHVAKAVNKNQQIHYLPPYRGKSKIKIAAWLGKSVETVDANASLLLIKAVINQRSVKEAQELVQMDEALSTTRDMHLEVMYETKAELRESDLLAHLMNVAHRKNVDTAYPVILTINGQTLHNHDHSNVLQNGQLLLGDFGAESSMHYAGDITRTIPVSGKFSSIQKDIYSIVLDGQNTAINLLKPEISYQEIHLACAHKMALGLKDLSIMKGDMAEAVNVGAHALFFPHGLGHMIGLDVHDMEDLGEDLLGYDDQIKRSEQFGLRSLRFGKKLYPGLVLTVEPGLYFIPELINMWSAEKKYADFINYDILDQFANFGGIRIEDNYVITAEGSKLLGPAIPKKIDEIQFLMSANKPL